MEFRQTAGIVFLFVLAIACREEDKTFASIEGHWKGTRAEVQVKPFGLPLPFTEEDESFDMQIEFKADGTMIVSNGSQPTEGTYQFVDDKLITDIELATEVIDLAGTYTIETLTETTLIFYLKRYDKISDPDSGRSVEGQIKATLHFQRI